MRERLHAFLEAGGYPTDIREELLVTPDDWRAQGMHLGTPFALAHTFLQSGPFRPVERRPPGAGPGLRRLGHPARRRHPHGAGQRQARGPAGAGVRRGRPAGTAYGGPVSAATPVTPPEVLAAGYARCAQITREHGTTYYWGARLLPAESRRHVHAVYTLARLADDIVDLAGPDPGPETALALDAFERSFWVARWPPVPHPTRSWRPSRPRCASAASTTSCFARFFAAMRSDLTRRTLRDVGRPARLHGRQRRRDRRDDAAGAATRHGCRRARPARSASPSSSPTSCATSARTSTAAGSTSRRRTCAGSGPTRTPGSSRPSGGR